MNKLCLSVLIIISITLFACSDSKNHEPQDMNNKGTVEQTDTEVSNNNFKQYSPKEAYDFLKKNKGNDNVILLDVRSPSEYRSSHLEGSLQVSYSSPDFKDELKKLDKEKKYILICQSGGRSEIAVKIMKNMNFKEAHNIEGGLSDWESQDLPLNFSE